MSRVLVRATVGYVVEADPTLFIGPNGANNLRWDHLVTYQGRCTDSSCNGKHATEAAAIAAGKREARRHAASVLASAQTRASS